MNDTEHLLVCLAEECSEVAQACAKSLRFGLDDRNVLDPKGPTNREQLMAELNDLVGVMRMLELQGAIPHWWDTEKQTSKLLKVRKFMDYAETVGALKRP